MAYCLNCGKALEGTVKFCRSCGSPVPEEVAEATAAPTPPPPPPVYPQGGAYPQTGAYPPSGTYPQQVGAYPQGGYLQGGAYPPGGSVPPKAGRSLKWLWGGIGALVVVVAVVCVLVFVVFKGGDGKETANAPTTVPGVATQTTGSGAATTQTTITAVSTTVQTVAATSSTQTTAQETLNPEQVVQQIFVAMENQDVDLLISIMDPATLGPLPEGATLDAVKAVMKEQLASMGTMKFSGIEMSTEMTSDTTATVTLTAGVMTVTDAAGQTTSEDIKDASSPVTVDLVKQDGTWYMESSPFL